VGVEAAITLVEFVARMERNITAEAVLEGRVSAERAAGLNASESLGVISKLADHCLANEWSNDDAGNVAAYLRARSKEQMLHGWNEISRTSRVNNVMALHKHIGLEVTDIIREARGLEPVSKSKEDGAAASTSKRTPVRKKR
jgi:arginine decarboxylase-like protein